MVMRPYQAPVNTAAVSYTVIWALWNVEVARSINLLESLYLSIPPPPPPPPPLWLVSWPTFHSTRTLWSAQLAQPTGAGAHLPHSEPIWGPGSLRAMWPPGRRGPSHLEMRVFPTGEPLFPGPYPPGIF